MAPEKLIPREDLDPSRLNQALVGTRFAGLLRHFAEIDSTNTMLLAAAATAPEGTVYVADEQTAGRGRGAHAWHSAPCDGLYVSALVKPSLRLRDALLLSLAAGLAASQAIREVTALHVDLRWPNDLLLPGADGYTRKLGGILVETAVDPGPDPMLRHAVIGIGVNVHHAIFPAGLRTLATSLALASAQPVARAPLLLALLRQLDLELTQLEVATSPAQLLDRFARHSSWVRGKRVSVPEQGGYTGVTAGLNPHGYLLVDSDDGVSRTVLTGGVREFQETSA